MVRETILVVSDRDTGMFDDVLKGTGCNVMRSQIETAPKSVRTFMREFGQGIPVGVVLGLCPNDASVVAEQLKRECGGIHVIALSDQVAQPVREGDKAYDVIIPSSRNDLRSMLETFLGFAEY